MTTTSRHRVPKDVLHWCTDRTEAIVASRKSRTSTYSEGSRCVQKDMIVALQLEVLRKDKEIAKLKKENGQYT